MCATSSPYSAGPRPDSSIGVLHVHPLAEHQADVGQREHLRQRAQRRFLHNQPRPARNVRGGAATGAGALAPTRARNRIDADQRGRERELTAFDAEGQTDREIEQQRPERDTDQAPGHDLGRREQIPLARQRARVDDQWQEGLGRAVEHDLAARRSRPAARSASRSRASRGPLRRRPRRTARRERGWRSPSTAAVEAVDHHAEGERHDHPGQHRERAREGEHAGVAGEPEQPAAASQRHRCRRRGW